MKMLTTAEAAKRLKISIRRVRALIEAGILKAEKFGRDWVIDAESIQEVAAKNRPRGRPKKSN